jgi:hypothetical protein
MLPKIELQCETVCIPYHCRCDVLHKSHSNLVCGARLAATFRLLIPFELDPIVTALSYMTPYCHAYLVSTNIGLESNMAH